MSHLTVTVNAVDPDVGAAIYARIGNPDGIETGPAAAALLLANQLAGIAMAAKMKIAVKVNTVLVDGINNAEAPKVAKMAASLGARMGNVMRHIPVPRSEFGNLIPASEKIWSDVARECERHLPQMRHCRQCRADAAGLLGQDLPLGDSPLRGSPLRQSPSRDLPSEDFPSQSCALRTSLDFTKLADGPRPMSAESPDPADSAGPAPRGAGFPPLPALFPPDLPEQPSMWYNRSEIDSKGIEAKEIESKEIEAKEIESKKIESKKIESKESKARDGELRERAANASMASQSAENAPNVIAEDAVASGEAADSEPSGHELAGNAGEIGQLLDSGVRVAVVSRGGLVLDQHFGQAERLLVYVSDGFQSRLSEIRHLAKGGACGRCGRNDTIGGPPKARPEGLILKLIEACSDCDAVLAMRGGESPRAKLEALGVACFASCGGVGEAVLAVARRLSERGREGVSAAGLIAAG